jgi:geranylgeranyl diphosphate synthase, type I
MTLARLPALDRGREDVKRVLTDMVGRLDPSTRRVVSYHLGWCDEHGVSRTSYGGKAIRSALTFLAADASGSNPRDALAGAVAVELVHNFSLVHDDVMDRDVQRRHRPTVWALWGDAAAVLAGDAMLSLAHEVLLECDSPHAAEAQTVIAVATRELIRGQAADTAFENRHDVTLSECLEMSWDKTAALLAASAVVGAVLGRAPVPVRQALGCYGGHLGMAFQLVDDTLGIWGRPEFTGKPVYSDLRASKKTLPVTWTIQHGGPAGRELADWLADKNRTASATEAQLTEIAELIERAGGRAWVSAEAHRRVALALDAVTRGDIAPGPASELRALAHYLIEREA